jgi:MarR family transcriptional regulator, organic hydroperoxide resistance regulator
MNRSVELAENQKSWMLLGTTVAVLERARNLELAKVGLNMPQTEVLYCLKISKEPMTPMKLSRMMHKQPHTVSALVHRMERQGLLATKRDLKRKNWVRVSLTKKGEEALKRWASANMVPDIFSGLSEKETDALSAIMKKLHNRGLELLRKMQPDPYSEPVFR